MSGGAARVGLAGVGAAVAWFGAASDARVVHAHGRAAPAVVVCLALDAVVVHAVFVRGSCAVGVGEAGDAVVVRVAVVLAQRARYRVLPVDAVARLGARGRPDLAAFLAVCGAGFFAPGRHARGPDRRALRTRHRAALPATERPRLDNVARRVLRRDRVPTRVLTDTTRGATVVVVTDGRKSAGTTTVTTHGVVPARHARTILDARAILGTTDVRFIAGIAGITGSITAVTGRSASVEGAVCRTFKGTRSVRSSVITFFSGLGNTIATSSNRRGRMCGAQSECCEKAQQHAQYNNPHPNSHR